MSRAPGRSRPSTRTRTLPLFESARRRVDARPEVTPTESRPTHVTTGLSGLDRALRGGFPVGALSLVAARPHVGATSLLFGAGLAALRAGERVACVSEHLKPDQVRGRFVVLESRVNGFRFQAGLITAEDRLAIAAARERLPWSLLSIATRARLLPKDIDEHLFGYRPLLVLCEARPRVPEAVDPRRFQAMLDGVGELADLAQRHQVALALRWILPKGEHPPELVELPGLGRLAEPASAVVLLHRDDVAGAPGDGGAQHVGEALARVVRVGGADVEPRDVPLRFDQRFAGFLESQ